MHRCRAAAIVLVVTLGCESSEDKVARTVAETEAHAYQEAAARSGDTGARQLESGAAKGLLNSSEAREGALSEVKRLEDFLAGDEARTATKAVVDEQTRLLGEAKKELAEAEGMVLTRRKIVEANRDKLLLLKTETEAALARPEADAGLSQEVLRERLSGIEASLAESTAALGGKRVGE